MNKGFKVEAVYEDSEHRLAPFVEDEHDIFIVEVGTENFWSADDFFYSVNIEYFKEF